MKIKELRQLLESTLSSEIKKAIMENVEDVYIIKNKKGEPIEMFENEEDAKKKLEVYTKEHPDKEFIIEKGPKPSFDDLDKMSEKLEETNMNNINETPKEGKGYFTSEQVLKLAKKAGEVIEDAKDDLIDLCISYEDKIPAHRVFEVLDEYDMSDLKSKIKIKKTEPKEEETCNECGDNYMEEESEVDESNAFVLAADAAKDKGEGEFEFPKGSGKMHKVTLKKDIETNEEECEECWSKEMGEEETCPKCGKDICECGSSMYESKKRKITLNETELVNLISRMVEDAVPGLQKAMSVRKTSGEQNKEGVNAMMKDVAKSQLSFKGNTNAKFPEQNGKNVEKVATHNSEEDNEYVDDYRGGKAVDLDYDTKPSKQFQDRLKKSLEGDSTTGNSQDSPNAIKSDLGEKMAKSAERKKIKVKNDPMYIKDPAPVKKAVAKTVNESEKKAKQIVQEEIKRMKEMAGYNKVTQ